MLRVGGIEGEFCDLHAFKILIHPDYLRSPTYLTDPQTEPCTADYLRITQVKEGEVIFNLLRD